MSSESAFGKPAPATPTPASERALGPDLARGLMLLFIALANSHYFLLGNEYVGGFPTDGTPVDSAVGWLLSTFVDGRAFPMFGLLFGYGVAHIVRRNAAYGRRAVNRILRRRSLILIIVGVVDGMLFYAGDILAMYGVLLFVGIIFLRRSDRVLIILAVAFFMINALPTLDATSISTIAPDASALPPDLPAMVRAHAEAVAVVALLGPIGFMAPFMIGVWAGRRRILERPAEHRRLLRVVAIGGIALAAIGAQPAALLVVGAYRRPGEAVLQFIGPLHDATGVLGGFGYAAAICLISTRLTNQGLVRAIAATGQRSMTCYLVQSPVWFVVFTPFMLDLADRLTVTSTALLAFAVWAATVALAEWMRRAGHRGPFETLTRWVSYQGFRRPSAEDSQGSPQGATGS